MTISLCTTQLLSFILTNPVTFIPFSHCTVKYILSPSQCKYIHLKHAIQSFKDGKNSFEIQQYVGTQCTLPLCSSISTGLLTLISYSVIVNIEVLCTPYLWQHISCCVCMGSKDIYSTSPHFNIFFLYSM